MSGAPAPDIKILPGTNPVMNDPDVVTAVADVLKAALGAGWVVMVLLVLTGVHRLRPAQAA